MIDSPRIVVNVMVFRQGMAYATYPMHIEVNNILAVMPYDVIEHEAGATLQLREGVSTPFADHSRNRHVSVIESHAEVRSMIESARM